MAEELNKVVAEENDMEVWNSECRANWSNDENWYGEHLVELYDVDCGTKYYYHLVKCGHHFDHLILTIGPRYCCWSHYHRVLAK